MKYFCITSLILFILISLFSFLEISQPPAPLFDPFAVAFGRLLLIASFIVFGILFSVPLFYSPVSILSKIFLSLSIIVLIPSILVFTLVENTTAGLLVVVQIMLFLVITSNTIKKII